MPYKYKDQVNLEMNKILTTDIIEKCNSRYINRIVVLKNSNGKL